MIRLLAYKRDFLNLFVAFNLIYLFYSYLLYTLLNLSLTSIIIGYFVHKYEDTIIILTRTNKYSNKLLILIDKTRVKIKELLKFKRYIHLENLPENNYVESVDDRDVINTDTEVTQIVSNIDVNQTTHNSYSDSEIEQQNSILGNINEPVINLNNINDIQVD